MNSTGAFETKSIKLIKDFYTNIFRNLKSKNIFYQYFDNKYSYKDLMLHYVKFEHYLKKIVLVINQKFVLYLKSLF